MNLREPLRTLLRGDASEEELQRVWRSLRQQRARRPVVTRRWAVMFGVLSLFVVLWVMRPFVTHPGSGPLRDTGGQTLGTLRASEARVVELSDGSRLELLARTEVEVLDNDGTSFACALRKGKTTFDVVPGGPRRWRVEAGAVRVEVVGTRFSVDRADDRVIVAVERGTVVVRGERVLDGVQKLTAGGHLTIQTPGSGPEQEAPRQRQSQESPKGPASASAAATSETRAPTSAGVSGDLLKLADEQRERGDLYGAIQTLRSAVERAPDPSRRAIAAFTLGKLLLDGAGRASEAEAAFRTCLRLSPPAAVAEDALARLVEAEARAAELGAARLSAARYERLYPNGRRLADVRRWASIH